MPNPTLYDNFSQVKQYIDQNQVDLSSYVSKSELSNCGYLTSVPSEYITQQELSDNSYLTQHQDISRCIMSPDNLSYNGQISLFPNGLNINQEGKIHAGWLNYNTIKNQNYHWMSSGSTRNMINGMLDEYSYATQSYVVDYVTEHGGSGEVTYSYLNDNYLPLSGGNMSGQLSLNNNVKLHIGSERPWEIYEGGTGGTSYLCLQNAVDGKHFYLKDVQGNNIVDIHNNVTGTGAIKLSYNLNTYTNSIVPNANYTYTLGNSNYYWSATYSYIINIGANNRFKALDNYNVCFYMGNSGKFNILSSAIRPSSSGGMNLGTNDYPWAYTYTNRVNFGSNKVYIYNNGDTQIKFGVNNADRFRIDYNSFVPSISGAVTQLGTSNNPFTNTYTSYLYTDTVYLQDTSYTSSIIPKETETYTLGVSGTIYKAIYSLEYNIGSNSKMYNDTGGFTFSVNGNNGFRIGSNALYPRSNKGYSIGSSSNNLAYTYTQNLILNGTDIKTSINGMFSYDSSTGTLTITTL